MFRKDTFIMKKHISASASSSSLLDTAASLLSKFLNKFIDSLFSDDTYDKKTDDKVSEETKKEAEQARKKNGDVPKSEPTAEKTDENGEQTESQTESQAEPQEVLMIAERIVATPKDDAEEAEDLDTFIIEKIQWPDTKDWFIKVTNKRTNKAKSEYVKNPSESTIQKTIEELKGEVTASKRIKVALNRIVGESEDTIDVTAINCSYDMGSAYTDICAVLDDDIFVGTIPEGDSAYEIIPTEDDYVVDAYAGEIDCGSAYKGAFDCATSFYACIFYLYINRNLTRELENMVESLKYTAQYHMDTLAKWTKMHDRTAEIKLCYCPDCCDTECPDSWTILKTELSAYKNCLEALYGCVVHEEQSVIDSWLLDIDYALYNIDNYMC